MKQLWGSINKLTVSDFLRFGPHATMDIDGTVVNLAALRSLASSGIFPIRYVSSTLGNNNWRGDSPEKPMAELAAAIGAVTANTIIVCLPGHVESIGNESLVLDVAGVSVLGLGRGTIQPRFHFEHANAEISVAADNVGLRGLRFSADVTAVAVGIEIEDGSEHCAVIGNWFDTVAEGTDEFNVAIRTNDAANFALIEDNDIDMGIAGAVAAVSFTQDTYRTIVRGNRVWGDFSTACVNGITTLSAELLIEKNLFVNGIGGNLNTEPAIELLTGSTGIIRDNDIATNLSTMAAAIVADTCLSYRNYYNEDISGGATGAVIGTPSADG